jgi:hypothetical protein
VPEQRSDTVRCIDGSRHMSALPRDLAAQPAVATDRFARKIVGFLAGCVMRLRRLNGNPFGTRGSVIDIPFRFGWSEWRFGKARCAGSGVPKPVVPEWYECPLCCSPVMPVWCERPWC